MSKEEVSKETLGDDDISALCAHFPSIKLPLVEHGVLFGGYSGTSIRVTGADGVKHVLKVCHGYSVADAMQQSAVATHAAMGGFLGVCAPVALGDATSKTPCVHARLSDGTPVMALTWVNGMAADKVLSAGKVDDTVVLASIGAGLAALHSVPVDKAAAERMRSCERGSGACDVAKHISGELLAKMRASEHTRTHPYLLDFYEAECAALTSSMAAADLPRGILHGDPFLDNMLCEASSGQLAGFVDLEDFCLGPLLFDVACCASAACFRPDGALDVRRLRALLSGYASVRPLSQTERALFLPFMRLTMLCNCTWRFINFNIDSREIESCRNAHVELQERITALHDDFAIGVVTNVLNKLPRTPTAPPPLFGPAHKDFGGKRSQRLVAAAVVGAVVGVAVLVAMRMRH